MKLLSPSKSERLSLKQCKKPPLPRATRRKTKKWMETQTNHRAKELKRPRMPKSKKLSLWNKRCKKHQNLPKLVKSKPNPKIKPSSKRRKTFLAKKSNLPRRRVKSTLRRRSKTPRLRKLKSKRVTRPSRRLPRSPLRCKLLPLRRNRLSNRNGS